MLGDDFIRGFTPRLGLILLTVLLLNGLLTWRLYSLQVQGGEERRRTTEGQSIRQIRLPAVRGRIFSADGQVLADNQIAYDVYLHLHELRQSRLSGTIRNVREKAGRVAKLTGRRNPLTEDQITRHLQVYPALPLKLFSDLGPDELARLYEAMPGIPGVEICPSYRRLYPLGETGAHIIGYLGRYYPNAEETHDAYAFYPERRGKRGIEARCDDDLAGTAGFRIVRVDSVGYCHEELSVQAAGPGHDVILTIDSRAQALGERLLNGTRGALVCLDANTGAVLALVSSPTYDLNRVPDQYAQLATDEERRPLLNRALAGGYSPGSIVKPLLAMALLENGVLDPATTVECPGYYTIGRRRIRCHDRYGHGRVNVTKALEVSCNPFFIDGGLKLTIDRLTPVFAAAGFGEPTGIELPGSFSQGRLPSRDSLLAESHRHWSMFDTALASIGQGYSSISPLHAAVYTAAIANGGTLYRPFIVRAVATADGMPVRETQPLVRGRLPVSPDNLDVVKAGMYNVVYGRDAAAATARNSVITLAGKTGTAEVVTPTGRVNNTWFICFGPFEDPRYALAILVEEGASGGRTAAPIAREFFDGYLPLAGAAAQAPGTNPHRP